MTATLLLADDSVTIQRVIELTFANEDIRVVSLSDGEAAVRYMAAERPDIVLADVGMPKMDGYDVATHIKQTPALKDIPVLLLTGAFEPIDEARARASGCDGILVKPFEPQQLVGRTKELLAGKHTAALWPAILPTVERRSAPSARPFLSVAPKPEPFVTAEGGSPAPPVPPQAFRPAAVLSPTTGPAAVPAPSALRPQQRDGGFQGEFDHPDSVLAEFEPELRASSLDEDTASGFARDPDEFRSVEAASSARPFGDWDLPEPPPQAEPGAPAASTHAITSDAWDLGASEFPATGAQASRAPTTPSREIPAAERSTAMKSPVSLAAAFSALLAAEHARPRPVARPAVAPTPSEAAIEAAIRRVLGRMTEEAVRQIVLETAERLIKDELEKIRTYPT